VARYMVLWTANASAWPTDPKHVLDMLQGVTAGGDQLAAAGSLKELGWFTPQSGYGIFEADTKAAVLGMVQRFFPLYTQEIHEIVAWEEGKQAILDSAAQAAAR
jgi:hypothetical protein